MLGRRGPVADQHTGDTLSVRPVLVTGLGIDFQYDIQCGQPVGTLGIDVNAPSQKQFYNRLVT